MFKALIYIQTKFGGAVTLTGEAADKVHCEAELTLTIAQIMITVLDANDIIESIAGVCRLAV